MLIEEMRNWLNSVYQKIEAYGYDISFTELPSSENVQAIQIDFESEIKIARITLEISGECDLEIIEIESEKTAFVKHFESSSRFLVCEALKEFEKKLLMLTE